MLLRSGMISLEVRDESDWWMDRLIYCTFLGWSIAWHWHTMYRIGNVGVCNLFVVASTCIETRLLLAQRID